MKQIHRHLVTEEVFNVIRNGFFAIYKPKDVTSAKILERLKDTIVKLDRESVEDRKHILSAGHGGTLDKTATGVLVVGICDGCKVLPFLLNGSKSYTVVGHLGISTDTYNETGAITSESQYNHITEDKLKNALNLFKGEFLQVPPLFSSLKKNGVCLSELARKGEKIEVKPRSVICFKATCTRFDPPSFTLDVECSKGFYIRSLVHDLGKALDSAAHVTSLVRTKHGPFTINDCLTEDYFTLQNIITWIKLTRKQYPELARYLDKRKQYIQMNK
uniref:tRNA pseudouridine(55) synthase n=1 Tax=Clastoptera arizonana TaxID=38151 RepID=A0A1B6DCN6_9HEMI